jgi:LysR family transcriptional regulator, benzoate and cis,cis-muconate-responsive activator of ben and cat genes
MPLDSRGLPWLRGQSYRSGRAPDTCQNRAKTHPGKELNYTRAAERLRITQPALSKQIAELERQLGFSVFRRSHNRIDITEAGQLFVNGCRLSLAQLEKAVHLARAANHGAGYTLTIGNSPHIDSDLISTALSINLPLYPHLKVRLESMFVLDLVHSLLAAEIDLALITEPPQSSQLTLVPLARDPIYVALPRTHAAASKAEVKMRDLKDAGWILLSRRAHPLIYDAVIERTRAMDIHVGDIHHVLTPREAFHLVAEHVGVAFLSKADALQNCEKDLSIIPLAEDALALRTYLALREDEPSRLINEFGRAYIKKSAQSSGVAQRAEQLQLLL